MFPKRCLCLRSNMTKRGKGLRKPQCSVCGSRSHRIETCSHPLAEKMRCLIAENRKLKVPRSIKVLKESKTDLGKTNMFKKAARKRHTGTDAVQTPPQRRTKDVVEEHHRIRSSDVFLRRPSCFACACVPWKTCSIDHV